METEGMSVKKASVSREAAQLLHLREADCPELRAQLAQLEVNWSKLTSDLSNIQDRLQQVRQEFNLCWRKYTEFQIYSG